MTIKVEFGGVEFAEVFRGVIGKEPTISKEIGSPAAFVFTSTGDVVYAGPADAEGIKIDEDFQQTLISGIEKNGGLKVEFGDSGRSSSGARIGNVKSLLSQEKYKEASDALSAVLSAAATKGASGGSADASSSRLSDDKIAALKALTNLEPASENTSKGTEQLVATALAAMNDRVTPLITNSSQGAQQATISAVKLAELDRLFGKFPTASIYFGQAWSKLEETSKVTGIKKQGLEIDKARKLEEDYLFAEAIAAYKQVVTTYAGSPAAVMSEKRISQLATRKVFPKREWKMAKSQFSFSAVLVKYDKTKKIAILRSGENELQIPVQTLSAEDKKYVESAE